MRNHLFAIRTLILILHQSLFEKISRLRTNLKHLFGVPIDLLSFDLAVYLLFVLVVKGWLAVKHDKYHNACTPNVNLGIVLLLIDDFWRHVQWTAQNLLELLIIGKILCKSKVS